MYGTLFDDQFWKHQCSGGYIVLSNCQRGRELLRCHVETLRESSYTSITDVSWENMSDRCMKYCKETYALSYNHAIIVEGLKYREVGRLRRTHQE
jgi:hypothetical protein